MSIDKLKELEREAARMHGEKDSRQRASEALAKMRHSSTPLWDQIDTLRVRWLAGSDAVARKALADVINEMKVDVYRIAELRLQAKARELGVKAAQREAVLQSCILAVPELERTKAEEGEL